MGKGPRTADLSPVAGSQDAPNEIDVPAVIAGTIASIGVLLLSAAVPLESGIRVILVVVGVALTGGLAGWFASEHACRSCHACVAILSAHTVVAGLVVGHHLLLQGSLLHALSGGTGAVAWVAGALASLFLVLAVTWTAQRGDAIRVNR